MKGLAALLLTVLVVGTSSSATPGTSTRHAETVETTLATPHEKSPLKELPDYAKPALIDPKEMLLQEIRSLDEETSNAKIQEEVAKALKAEAEKSRTSTAAPTTTVKKRFTTARSKSTTGQYRPSKKVAEADDMTYDDELDEDEEDEDEDEYDEDEDDSEDDDDNDDDDDDDGDGDGDGDGDLEEVSVMTFCPDYCKCAGQYAAAMTATCTKLVDDQTFPPGIANLRVENAGQIRLGPHALRARGLQQLESIVFVDTKIIELDRTAFDGITYLFAVNLTRNGLQDIHPHTFQNNTQLSLLTISGNPLHRTQIFKGAKHYLLDAASVTELDFSNNGVSRLPRTAFSKMPNLGYISLKGNKLREIDNKVFGQLESLVELDLSNNMLTELPIDLFDNNKGLQTLRVIDNNLTTLSTVRALKLTSLDISNNKIKVIGKDDLSGVPLLDQLTIRSNGLKRIHQHAFSSFEQLTLLDIRDNKLTSITEHHFRNNPRLQILLMSDNPDLETLPIFKPSGLEYDTYSIYRLDCSDCGLYYLEEGTFDAMPALTRLNLARNSLRSLPTGMLDKLSSLRHLDLSDNIIGSLEANMFRGATTLTKLNLSGNPLVTLQVTPFLLTPGLTRLDVSRCALERVWSEARIPLKSLRSLSVRGNLLRRITLEELRATPKLASLDLTHNPLNCDEDFDSAVQWLTDHGVSPMESYRYISNYGEDDADANGISQWTDLAKIVCTNVDDDGPATRPAPHLPTSAPSKRNKTQEIVPFDETEEDSLLKQDFDEEFFTSHLHRGMRPTDEEIEKAWANQDREYEDYSPPRTLDIRPWYSGALWPVITVIVATLAVLLVAAHVAVCLAKRRGRGPVIRPPMILRQGLMDNKNCGLVYKPLQEEIATPHMPKRGSFYSSSTFHYDKIVPESV